MVVVVVVVVRRAGSGDPSLLSSVPGRPRELWRKEGWTLLGQRLCRRERVESGGPHVYVRQAKGVRVGGFAWLSGAGGLGAFKGIKGLNQATGFVRAFWGSGSGWQMAMAREQTSGGRAGALFTSHFDTTRQSRRGTAEATR